MRKYIILIITMLFVSCTNQPNRSLNFTKGQIDSLHLDSTKILKVDAEAAIMINLNPYLKKQSFDFGTKVKEVRLIPLETTDESLLGNIYKVIATDSINYIFDDFKGGGIVLFDKDGKFIKRISNGDGPGELFRLGDIAYDKEHNELIVYQHPFFLFYTSKGGFIRQERLPFGFYNFIVTSEGYIFKTIDGLGNEHLDSKKDNTLLVTDKKFKLKYAGLPTSPTNINYGGYSYLYSNDNMNQISQNYTDTIYHYLSDSNELKALYIMDYNEKKLPEQYLEGDGKNFRKILSQNDYYYYIGEYLETKSHHVFFLRNDYIGLQTIIYRDKVTGNLIGGTNADFNINEIPAIGFPKATFGEYFISIHLPNKDDHFLSKSSIITDEDKRKMKKLKEDDNPILVFYRLKNI